LTGEMGVALDLMRLEGICKMLLESLEADELETKFLTVTGQQKIENIKNSLLKLTKAELRQIVELSPTITESVIKNTTMNIVMAENQDLYYSGQAVLSGNQ